MNQVSRTNKTARR